MRVENLIIETTRRCNMQCKHCLRGKSQNIDMPLEYIDKLFNDITEVNSLTFTGGEPFLNIKIIEYTLEIVKKKKIPVYSFFIATNAKHVEDRYINVLNNWIMYVMENEYDLNKNIDNLNKFDDEELFNYSGVAVSRDSYHEPIPMENYLRYRMLAYYIPQKEHSDEMYIIAEGNALENGLGNKRNISEFYIDIEENDFIIVDTLYLSSIGEIVSDCDLSYKHMAEYSIGNINNHSIRDIIKNYYENQLEEMVG